MADSISQSQENVCSRCEESFSRWSVYHAHVVSRACLKKVLPIRTSNRTKAEIVRDFEEVYLKGRLVQ